MTVWQGLNINTGETELPKYNAFGETTQIYVAALTTALANGDTILGPVVPAGQFMSGVTIDVDALDSNGTPTLAFEVGIAGTPAKFIATGNTTARAGGIQSANVAGTNGTKFAVDTAILVTITAGPATAVAGNMRIKATYTASP